MRVDDAELPLVSTLVRRDEPLDDLLRGEPSRSSASPSGP